MPDFSHALLQIENELVRVSVPVFDVAVLAASEEVVGLGDEFDCGNSLTVGEYGLDAVSEVKPPELDVFVDAASQEQCFVAGNIIAEDR